MTESLEYLLITVKAIELFIYKGLRLSWKKSLLAIYKGLRFFVNILTIQDKYSPLNRDNLMQPTQTQLSLKQKMFF